MKLANHTPRRPRAGLLLLLKSKLILIRTRRFEAYLNQGSFERTQIPRGGVESTLDNGLPFIAALREFIEETQLLPVGECLLCRESFTLKWLNNNRWHEYQIFLIIAKEMKRCKQPVLFVSWANNSSNQRDRLLMEKLFGQFKSPYTKFGNSSLIKHVSDTFIQARIASCITTNNQHGNLLVAIAPNGYLHHHHHHHNDRVVRRQMQYDTQYEVVQCTLSEFIICKQRENGSNVTNYLDLFKFLYNKIEILNHHAATVVTKDEHFLPLHIQFSSFIRHTT